MTIDRYFDVGNCDESAILDGEIETSTVNGVDTESDQGEIARLKEELAQAEWHYQRDIEVLSAQLDLTAAEVCINAARYDRATDELRTEYHDRLEREEERQRLEHVEHLERLELTILSAAAEQAALEEQIEDYQERLAAYRKQAESDRAQVVASRARITELESSTSWRLTAGLRLVGKLMRGG